MVYDVSDIGRAAARKLSQLDFVANNIANASTSGFKAEHLYFSTKGKKAQDDTMTGLGTTSSKIDFSQGTLNETGNTFDLAIEGEGFFNIQTPQGIAYTRNGSFLVNNNKELVTKSGDYVLGDSGKIIIDGNNVNIDKDGTVYVDDGQVAKLKISTFNDPYMLTRSSNGHFVDGGGAGMRNARGYRVAEGFMEMSNVNAVREMIDMMEIQRTFETYQKIILTLSDMDKISTSRIGKLI